MIHLILDDILLIMNYCKNRNTEVSENTLTNEEQRIVIKLSFKILDVVLQCVMGYFDTFKTCWVKCVDCLQIVMLKYIDFLDNLCKNILEYPTCIYTCCSAVLVTAISCVMLWITLDSQY